MSAVCLLSAESQVGNTDFKATVLNFACFLFRIKMAIIAVFGARWDELMIKMDLTLEWNVKSTLIPTNAISESEMDKAPFSGLGEFLMYRKKHFIRCGYMTCNTLNDRLSDIC